MRERRLNPEESRLWGKVARTVRPLPGRQRPPADEGEGEPVPAGTSARAVRRHALATEADAVAPARLPRRPADMLDNSWEKRIARGALMPDHAIDLHGHSLAAAHRHFMIALAAAVLRGDRVLLVVTGKPRAVAALPGERARGAIRSEIGHWIATSPHADAIASVRAAHPRHGGAGALYVILRRGA